MPYPADDTAFLQNAMAVAPFVPPKGEVYRITSQISGHGIEGDCEIVVDSNPGYFDNVNLADQFGAKAAAINLTQPRGRLCGVKIRREGPDTAVRAVMSRGVPDILIDDIDVSGFGVLRAGYLLFDTSQRLQVINSKIHDCTTNRTDLGWIALAGISVDGSRLDYVYSREVKIERNGIRDLTCGPAYTNWQTDGIECGGVDGRIVDNDIEGVGEAIDVAIGQHMLIATNSIRRIKGVGIKVAHGARYMHIVANSLKDIDWIGIGVFTDPSDNAACGYTTICANRIFNAAAGFPASPKCAIACITGTGATVSPVHMTVQANDVIGLGPMEYGFVDAAHPTNEYLYNRSVAHSIAPWWNNSGARWLA